jgi:hypothetical protein
MRTAIPAVWHKITVRVTLYQCLMERDVIAKSLQFATTIQAGVPVGEAGELALQKVVPKAC